ncbi:MAG: HNH endonuclease, partial [Acidimicrobiales bacterium]|nr:HNH endonuclease [Acidimicrobiales bacterium]
VGRKLRRAILFRHRHRCAVPGCDAARGLDIHHIVHWEDGGPTDTANLVALCRRHHTAHHRGLLDIAGDADLPPGAPGALVIADPEGDPLPSAHPPVPVPPERGPVTSATVRRLHRELDARSGRPHRRRYRPPVAHTPTGERLRRHDVHLQAEPPDPPLRT